MTNKAKTEEAYLDLMHLSLHYLYDALEYGAEIIYIAKDTSGILNSKQYSNLDRVLKLITEYKQKYDDAQRELEIYKKGCEAAKLYINTAIGCNNLPQMTKGSNNTAPTNKIKSFKQKQYDALSVIPLSF